MNGSPPALSHPMGEGELPSVRRHHSAPVELRLSLRGLLQRRIFFMEPFEEEAALLGLLNERAECSNRTKVTKTDGKTESWPDRIIRKAAGENFSRKQGLVWLWLELRASGLKLKAKGT